MENQTIPTKPIAVIGLGAVMPDAPDLEAFWNNILTGVDSIREVPEHRWRPLDHFSPDRKAPDKSYTKIGAFISDFSFDSTTFRIPPKVAEAMDDVQKWAVDSARQALAAAGYLERDFDRERCAVVLGNALGGEMYIKTSLRVHVARFIRNLTESEAFGSLPQPARDALLAQFESSALAGLPPITEDTMPGELSNVIAGRVAQAFGLRGPNFTTDAACASSLAALQSAMAGLNEGRYDMVLTGGVDSSMGPQSFVKFSKIGALSADGSRPFDERADGFVMGEGCGVLLLKRLADAERDGDPILAVIQAVGSSSDGRGKGITAPNPIGQRLAVERAYQAAGLSPAQVGLLEAHGTSTTVGDRVEVEVTGEILREAGAQAGQVAMGSVKSQIGHLKSAAGAAALIKATLALHHKRIPGSLHFERPNAALANPDTPFYVPTETRDWPSDRLRVAGVSSFGFGGTNFHAVLSEYVPARQGDEEEVSMSEQITSQPVDRQRPAAGNTLTIGAADVTTLKARVAAAAAEPSIGQSPDARQAAERVSIAFKDAEDLARKLKLAQTALESDEPARWRAFAAQGLFRGRGQAGKVAFLFPGQGSQYVNMLADLRTTEPVVAETFAEADAIMQPVLGAPLSGFVFTEDTLETRAALQDTTVCQPAMLAADVALARLLAERGLAPDMVAGHSLGEYAALVVAGMLTFEQALQAVCARAKEMAGVQVDDPGKMAAVFAPADLLLKQIERFEGVVPANYNSHNQTVLAGTTAAMQAAMQALEAAGVKVVELPVSHAFHSYVVAPASAPLREVIARLGLKPPRIPVIANLDAEAYDPDPAAVEGNTDRLARQVASPVRWVETIENLHRRGARLFVEVGPKKILANFVADILDDPAAVATMTNHPKLGDGPSLNLALAAAAAAGHPRPAPDAPITVAVRAEPPVAQVTHSPDGAGRSHEVISGVGFGLPGSDGEVFAEDNAQRMLSGYAGISPVPDQQRDRLADQRIVRLVKNAPGGPAFEVIDAPDRVAQLTGRRGRFDLAAEFGLDPERSASFDITTRLAIGAGLLALRDAGLPLVMHYRTTSTGSKLPIGWRLPSDLSDETGVIFASAFPGYDEVFKEVGERGKAERLQAKLEELRALSETIGELHAVRERIAALEAELGDGYHLDRRFIFRALSLGHAQLAEQLGLRGPNTQVNSACASTTLGLALAQDWLRAGRCRRVLVVGADDITNPRLAPWLVGGLLATGAVTTEARLEDAALPFDRRRNGMIPGMGAVGLVVEKDEEVTRRGMRPLVKLLGTELANSAYHGARLDPEHIAGVVGRFIDRMETEHSLDRRALAAEAIFVSHETYTPARGGSASAEVRALREAFGSAAEQLVIVNTKGYTGHPMGVGIEEAALVRMLEHQQVPPIPNLREPDPELGNLRLSTGGKASVRYALRLAAGFGSQVALTLSERVDGCEERVANAAEHQAWLDDVSGISGARLEVENKTLRVAQADARPADRSKQESAAPQAQPAEPEPVVPTPEPEAPAPAEPTPQTPVALRAQADVDVEGQVLALVADKTGYPVDMLEQDLDLEADLGIDTVKQAEMFSEIRAAFGIPKQDDLKLSDYPTLAHIIQFARDHVGQPAPAQVPPAEAPAQLAPVEAESAPVETSALATEVDVEGQVLALVADKTGYPVDMLERDLDLEADLGIDTVKQAEMFSEIRAAFGIPKQDDLKLSDYPTLAHIIQFARDHIGQPAPAQVPPAEAPAQLAPVEAESAPVETSALATEVDVEGQVLALVADKTGYPVDMLERDLDLEADLGIDTVKQAEMFSEIRAAFDIPKQDDLKLSDYPTLAHIIRFAEEHLGGQAAAPADPAPDAVFEPDEEEGTGPDETFGTQLLVPRLRGRPDLIDCLPAEIQLTGRQLILGGSPEDATAMEQIVDQLGGTPIHLTATDPDGLTAEIARLCALGPVQGCWLLPPATGAGLDGDDERAWQLALDARARMPFRLAKAVSETLRKQPGSFLAAATRTGGLLGIQGRPVDDPLIGLTHGLVKTLAREWPEVQVKLVDVEAGLGAEALAEVLAAEVQADPGCVEIGRRDQERYSVVLNPARPATDPGAAWPPVPEPVVLVTGGTGGIASRIAADLAAAGGGTYYLVGRAALPDAADEDLALLRADRNELKARLVQRLKQSTDRVTPVMVEAEIRKLERGQAVLDALTAIRAAGGTAHHAALDITDAHALDELVDRIGAEHGRLDVVLHAAGVDHSLPVERKTPEGFETVLDPKVQGLRGLLRATRQVDLKLMVLFGSIAGRFGNPAQTDYAAANDLLAKAARTIASQRAGLRVLTLAYGPWAEVGMASRGSIPQVMERAGIQTISVEQGAASVRQALGCGLTGEVVVAADLGSLRDVERANALDPARLVDRLATDGEHLTLLSRVLSWTPADGLHLEVTFDAKRDPYLGDHRIDGTPVVPGVMAVECFAEAVRLLHPEPGTLAVERLRFDAPLKLYKQQPRSADLYLIPVPTADGQAYRVRMETTRQLAGDRIQRTCHYRACVKSGPAQEPPRVTPPRLPDHGGIGQDTIYKMYFHGPTFQVLERAGATPEGGLAGALAPGRAEPALGRPGQMTAQPMLTELAFQTAGLLQARDRNQLGLPAAVERLDVHPAGPGDPGRIAAWVVEDGSNGDDRYRAKVVDERGYVLVELTGYRTAALPGGLPASVRDELA